MRARTFIRRFLNSVNAIFTSTLHVTFATFGVAYRVYNNYAHATRLIESFFFTLLLPLPPSRSIHRSCRPNNPPPRVSICAFLTFVYRRCVRTRERMCGKGDTILRREKQHRRTERERWRGKRRTIFSFSFRLSLSLSCVRVSLTRRTLHCERGMRCERREFPVVNVFGCICLSLLSPSHARARAPIKAPRIKVTAPFP